jgi:hypothetical protein
MNNLQDEDIEAFK